MTEGFIKARWFSSWAFYIYCLPLKLTLSGPRLQAAATSGVTQTCLGVSGSLSELLELSISTSEEDMVRGMKRGVRWEEIVNRWPFRKGVNHSRAPGLYLHYIWPRGKPSGPT
jgi:hypothetical protein